MEYDFSGLGSKNFEHMVQSLATRTLGPRVTTFGAGADGGREATWDGEARSLGILSNWNGYGVVQAKYADFVTDTASGLTWIKSRVSEELAEWARTDSKRTRKPDFMLFATNVRLSPVPGYGKDAIKAHVAEKIRDFGLPISDFRVWDHDDMASLLDNAEDVRRRYAAFITAGDAIAQLLDEKKDRDRRVSRALRASVARSLSDDSHIGLTQAGAMGDSRVTIADVFVDLPIERQLVDSVDEFDAGSEEPTDGLEQEDSPEEELARFVDQQKAGGVASHLIHRMNVTRTSSSDRRRARHTVLVGGPGQGKSTVTQWLSQLYRCEFLRHAPIADNPEIGQLIENLDARASALGMPSVAAKRWPFRIVLTEFADFIAANPDSSLMSFIANRVSAGGAAEVDQEDMATWLETFPWVLFIDGLDEVPKSSNRDQVVKAIRHFFFEADNVGGDVVAVATTRPQGYSNEFAAEAYEHVQLQSLDTETALNCAKALLDVRFGGALSMVEKVMMRLEKAAGDASTARLFASPLQVTILTVLLEKLGKPPGDRWRLFSAYYKVISDREQEKSGELSELLQRFDSDIDAIHRTVGYLLQQRSSEAGETSASLTKQEFEQVVRRQFEAQGHQPAEVDALLDDFTRLVTDRLVFLTYESSDRLGFELRSLQEFMAAEFVVNFPEAEVPDLLRSLAQSSHWRNVLLFAIGGIFAQRAPLRAEVTLLCAELNRVDSSADVLLLGSDLAVGVLSDGSCLSMPKYARQLAATAAEVVDRGMWRRIFELTELRDSYTLEAVKNASSDLSPGVGADWLGRAIALSRLTQRHPDLTDDLARLISAVPAEFAPLLVLHSLQQNNMALARAVEGLLHHCDPTQLMNGHPLDRFSRESDREDDTRPLWVRQLRAICAPPASEEGSGVGLGLSFRYHTLRSSPDAWEWLARFSRSFKRWDAVRAVSEFASDPTRDSLGRTLELLADLPRIKVFRGMPWVLSACIRWVDECLLGDAQAPSLQWKEGLLSLASAARAGDFGDQADWLLAEEQSPSGSALTAELVKGWSSFPTDPGFPLAPALAALGVPPWGSGFELRSVSSDEGKSVGHLVDEMIKLPAVVAGGRRGPAGGVVEFAVGHFLASRAVVAKPETALAQWEWLEASFAAGHEVHVRWAPWIDSLTNGLPVDRDKLIRGLAHANIWLRAEDESRDVRDFLLSAHVSGLEQWRTLRLAAQVDPDVLRKCAPIWPDPIPESDSARSLFHAHRVATAVEQSHFDEAAMLSAEVLASGLGGPFDMNWLVNLVQNEEARLICDLVRRIGANFPLAVERLETIVRAKAVAGSPEPIVGL